MKMFFFLLCVLAFSQAQQNPKEQLEYLQHQLDQFLMVYNPPHEKLAHTYLNIAKILHSHKQHKKALLHYQKALSQYEQLQQWHYSGFVCGQIADVFHTAKNYQNTLVYYQKSLKHFSKIYTAPNVNLSNCYINVGYALATLGRYKESTTYYLEGFKQKKQLYKTVNADLAVCCGYVSDVFFQIRDYKQALIYTKETIGFMQKLYQPPHPTLIKYQHQLGQILVELGDYKKALESFRETLRQKRRLYKPPHITFAYTFDYMGYVFLQLLDYSQALAYYQKALEIKKLFFRSPHVNLADSYGYIGRVFMEQAHYKKALENFQQQLVQVKGIYTPPHRKLAIACNDLSSAFSRLGRYSEAIEYLQMALKQQLQLAQPPNLDLAVYYANMGHWLPHLGRHEHAEEYMHKALKQFQQLYKAPNVHTATCYNNFGHIYEYTGRHKKALQSYQKSLEQRLRLYKSPHPYIAILYSNIGNVLASLSQPQKALKHYQLALKQQQQIYKKSSYDTSLCHYNIGYILQKMGKHKEAIKHLSESLRQRKQIYQTKHPEISSSYERIGYSLLQLEDYQKSWQNILTCFSMRQKLFQKELPVLSTLDKVKRAKQYFNIPLFHLLTLLDTKPNGAWLARAFAATIYRKDLIARVRSYEREIKLLARNATLDALYHTYQEKVKKINALSFKPSLKTNEQKQLLQLLRLKERLERQISKTSAHFFHLLKVPTLSLKQIQKKLTKDSILLEYVVFYHYKHQQKWMGLFLIKKNDTSFISLGAYKNIAQTTIKIRELIQQDGKHAFRLLEQKGRKEMQKYLLGAEQKVATHSEKLRHFIWPETLQKQLQATNFLFISPDDCLHFLPFAILPYKKGKEITYFVEKYNISYLPSGASLLNKHTSNGRGFYSIGDPDYNMELQAFFATTNKNMPMATWKRLEGSLEEIKKVKNLYTRHYKGEKALLHVDKKALKSNFVKEIQRKKWIHIATHGFFLQPEVLFLTREEISLVEGLVSEKLQKIFAKNHYPISASSSIKSIGKKYELFDTISKQKFFLEKLAKGLKVIAAPIEKRAVSLKNHHPLLLSGLVLAGANKKRSQGYITAADIALLDLRGVKCVVLSCCETGLGTTSGVGVFGFKWAFEYAGVRYLLTSLWKVSDADTLVLMTYFYQKHKKFDVWQALLKAQGKFLENQRYSKSGKTHPYFWGAFVCQGNALPLQIAKPQVKVLVLQNAQIQPRKKNGKKWDLGVKKKLPDVFVKVYFHQKKSWKLLFTSRISKNSLSPSWQQTIDFPVTTQTKLKIEVYDKDIIKNDIIGIKIVTLAKSDLAQTSLTFSFGAIKKLVFSLKIGS